MPHEPKRRHSKARKNTRRAAIKLEQFSVVICSNCQKPVMPHQVCKNCGFYAGRQVQSKASSVKVTKA